MGTTEEKSASLKSDFKLRPHQQDAVKQFVKNDGKLILFHDVGTGKTGSAIAAVEKMRSLGKANKTLVVVPGSLRDNFAKDGVKKFTNRSYKILGNKGEAKSKSEHIGIESMTPKKSGDYNVVSYDMFKQDPVGYVQRTGADTVIYDEIHKAKNETSGVSKAMKEARPHHRNFLGLTGSLVSNSPADLVPIVDAMTDGEHYLGSRESFEGRFLEVHSDGKKTIKKKETLRNIVAPYIHFVDKDSLGGKKPPRKIIKNHNVTMTETQSSLYRKAIDKLDMKTKAKLFLGIGKLSDGDVKHIGNKLMGARQASNGINSLIPSMSLKTAYEHSAKTKKLLDNVAKHIKETPDAQVIIGTQFVNGGADILEYGLKQGGISYGKFLGKGNKGVTEQGRLKAVKDYNDRKTKVMLISSAGSEGLNLPNTTEVHIHDGHFNPEVGNQMEARGIRSGGLSHREEKDRKVTVHRYHAVPNIRATEVGEGLMEAVNPMTYLARAINGEKMFQAPKLKPFSADKWLNEVAINKNKNNEEIKSMLNKSGALRRIESDEDIMRDYQAQYGSKIKKVIGTSSRIDKGEGAYINRLRSAHKTVAESPRHLLMNTKGSMFKPLTDDDFNADDTLKATTYLNPLKNTTAAFTLGSLGATGLGTIGMKKALRARTKAIANNAGEKKVKTLGLLGDVAGGVTSLSIPGSILGPLSLFAFRNATLSKDTKPKAARKKKLSDEELLRMLRGENITKEKLKIENFAI